MQSLLLQDEEEDEAASSSVSVSVLQSGLAIFCSPQTIRTKVLAVESVSAISVA